MKQSHKGRQWLFDMKAHISLDANDYVKWHVAMLPGLRKLLDRTDAMGALTEQVERIKVRIRAKGKHPFPVVKRQFGHVKFRHCALVNTTAPLHTLFAPAIFGWCAGV